jgi:hypothetical protein
MVRQSGGNFTTQNGSADESGDPSGFALRMKGGCAFRTTVGAAKIPASLGGAELI